MKLETVRIWAAAVVVFTAIAQPLRAQTTFSVTPTADTVVKAASPRKNFGVDPFMELRANTPGAATEAYLQFPLLTHKALEFMDRVVLRIYGGLEVGGNARMLVRSVPNTPWEERSVTWLNRPEHGTTLGTLEVVGQSSAWYELDVTRFILAEIGGGYEHVTFAFVPAALSKYRIQIHSRESDARRPELVFSRRLFNAKVIFLPAAALPPIGYLPDNGEVFGLRECGLHYGWDKNNTSYVRDRTDPKYSMVGSGPIKTADRRYDFTAYMDHESMAEPTSWEIAVPNSTYRVRMVAGDSWKYDSIFAITAEEKLVLEGVPDKDQRWIDVSVSVTVTDGRLSIGNHQSSSNNKLSFIEIAEQETLLTRTP